MFISKYPRGYRNKQWRSYHIRHLSMVKRLTWSNSKLPSVVKHRSAAYYESLSFVSYHSYCVCKLTSRDFGFCVLIFFEPEPPISAIRSLSNQRKAYQKNGPQKSLSHFSILLYHSKVPIISPRYLTNSDVIIVFISLWKTTSNVELSGVMSSSSGYPCCYLFHSLCLCCWRKNSRWCQNLKVKTLSWWVSLIGINVPWENVIS